MGLASRQVPTPSLESIVWAARSSVTAIGSAVLEVAGSVEEKEIESCRLVKGACNVVPPSMARRLRSRMTAAASRLHGDAALAAAHAASQGAASRFIGSWGSDENAGLLTELFDDDGVSCRPRQESAESPTGMRLVLTTPDGVQTIAISPGASLELDCRAIDPFTVRSGSVLYLESALWQSASARLAMRRAAQLARLGDRTVVLGLSQAEPAGLAAREELLSFIRENVDLLIGGSLEACMLYQVSRLDSAVPMVRRDCALAVLTRFAAPSILVSGDEVRLIDLDEGIGRWLLPGTAEYRSPLIPETALGARERAGVPRSRVTSATPRVSVSFGRDCQRAM